LLSGVRRGEESAPTPTTVLGRRITLSSDGWVHPCAFLRSNAYAAGNVRNTSLQAIYYTSHVFRALRRSGVRCCQELNRDSALLP
jgi:MoaA/NifB/PqqE/SkfB family radical SAM enzyme